LAKLQPIVQMKIDFGQLFAIQSTIEVTFFF